MNFFQISFFLVVIAATSGLVYKNPGSSLIPYMVRQTAKPVFMNVKIFLFVILFLGVGAESFSQNFTSTNSGSWTTGSNWGGTAPATAGQSWGAIIVKHNLKITGNYDFRGGSVTINAGKTLTITGDFSISNGPDINVYGTLIVNGNVTLNANLNVFPGGEVIVDKNVTVVSSTYLNIGTSATPGSYADMNIKGNLILNGGKATVEKNGRLAVFQNVISNGGGGARLTIVDGGQTYVDGNVNLTSGGDKVTNANDPTPIGLYINGASTTNGNGASVTTNQGDKATMKTNDKPFYDWVAGLTNSPLPITLISFKAAVNAAGVSLTWSTASEKNFDKFIVERSSDGVTFEAIGEVHGAGNSNTILNYGYDDVQATIGVNYYRLKSLDFDYSFEYSKLVFVQFAGERNCVIYPNPSNGESVKFTLNFMPGEDDKITVSNLLGVEVAKVMVLHNSGEILFGAPLQGGAYIIEYQSSVFKKVDRLVVK